mmetsp:Transcript_8998/g.15632  ORF Transcript_8998/g.15632 Transcript_8998/m.15632 type:complete len:111 (+) Transcript_8998:250-582(+)
MHMTIDTKLSTDTKLKASPTFTNCCHSDGQKSKKTEQKSGTTVSPAGRESNGKLDPKIKATMHYSFWDVWPIAVAVCPISCSNTLLTCASTSTIMAGANGTCAKYACLIR